MVCWNSIYEVVTHSKFGADAVTGRVRLSRDGVAARVYRAFLQWSDFCAVDEVSLPLFSSGVIESVWTPFNLGFLQGLSFHGIRGIFT